MSTRDRYVPRSIRGNAYGGLGVGDILDVPRARIYCAAAGFAWNGGFTAPLDTTIYAYDITTTFGGYGTGAGLTMRTQGLYHCSGSSLFNGAAGTYRRSYLIRTSTTYGNANFGTILEGPTLWNQMKPADVIRFAAGDTLTLFIETDAVATMISGIDNLYLSACLVSTI